MKQEEPWPYCLPIFRSAWTAASPDGKLQAEISQAYEISMSNPTIGRLKISDGLVLDKCNPSFLWSDDSRYLAVPQLRYFFGLLFAMRIVVVDTRERLIFTSRRFTAWIQPRSFASGMLVVCLEPYGSSREVSWEIPSALAKFDCSNYP